LFDDYVEDKKHILIKTFCELLTQTDFIIRKNSEFITCSVCNSAIPCEESYNKLKKSDIKTAIPEKWSNKCTDC